MQPADSSSQNVTVNIDLPGEVGMETIKCKSCGGVLTEKDVKLVAGAPRGYLPLLQHDLPVDRRTQVVSENQSNIFTEFK